MSFDLLASGSAFLECASRLVTTLPADVVFAVKQRSNSSDCEIFKQQTATSDAGFAVTLPAFNTGTDAPYRNQGGSPNPVINVPNSRGTGVWKWYRLRLTNPSSRQLNVGTLSATSTVTVTNDLGIHDRFTLGCTHWASGAPNNFLDGLIAELGVFDGGSISDADFAAVQAGTKYLENIAGITTALSCLTMPSGSTITASDGKVFTLNGTVTQGADHPVTRTTPVPVSFSGPVPTRNGVLGTASTFANAGFFAGNLTPFTYSSVGAALPAGVTLNTSTGVLSLAASGASAGTTSGIIIRATDTGSNIANTNAYSIVIAASNAAPTFPGNISNLSGTAGSAITPVNVSGQFSDTDTLTYSASPAGTAWPSGLVVNSSTGIISGTVAGAGTTSGLKVRATDTASQTVDSNAFNAVIGVSSATRTWTPTIKLEALADETPFANWAVHAVINDMAGNLIGTKTGLTTSSVGLPPPFTSSFGSLATDYRVTYVDDTDLTIFAVENLRCV